MENSAFCLFIARRFILLQKKAFSAKNVNLEKIHGGRKEHIINYQEILSSLLA
jgi:hypothetical protein